MRDAILYLACKELKRQCFVTFVLAVVVFALQKLSPENLPDGAEVYYSDDEADNLESEVYQDPSALLAQLTSGVLPSQATIELAVAQLREALAADEKQLMQQLMQQMLMMNPVLFANPLAAEVEAIRILLTSRGQRALMQGHPAVQQMALQANLQNLPQSNIPSGETAAAAQSTSVMAEACRVPPLVNHHEDIPSQSQPSKHSHDHSGHSMHWAPKGYETVPLGTEPKYADESSSTSSGHVRPTAGHRSARGRGRSAFVSDGLQNSDEMCQQDSPRGRGVRRGKIGNSVPEETISSRTCVVSTSVHQPLVPPPLHATQKSQQNAENWEEEIQLDADVFSVKSSFFKPGKK